MRKAREILRLKHELGLTNRQIGRSVHLSHVAVGKYLQLAKEAGIHWPLPPDLEDEQLKDLLYASEKPETQAARPLPPMEWVHTELRKKGVTLQLLWEEYHREHPDGYGYTQFCEYYKRYRSHLEPALRKTYKAGEQMFVDWAGQKLWFRDADELRPAHLFVAVLGASNYTYAEAFESTQLPCWVQAHTNAWEFFGGVALLTVPDNDKSAVTRACRYEPGLNPTTQEMAEHYGTVILPTRPGKPKDKAKVEAAVLNAERRILAALRDQRFFSLAEVNGAVGRELEQLNRRPFKKLPGSRAELFETLDKPALKPLPAQRYELAEWRKAKVNIDYHVQVDNHLYSVPYRLISQEVEARLKRQTVEIFHRGKRVAMHARSHRKGGFSTDAAHRPKAHQRHLEWSPGRLVQWAGTIGEHCSGLVEQLLQDRPHPEQGYRSCLGIMRLGRRYGSQRVEAACRRARALDACSYQSIKSILETNLDRQPIPEQPSSRSAVKQHANVRGAEYYEQPRPPQEAERDVAGGMCG